jgi:hypothetical protein
MLVSLKERISITLPTLKAMFGLCLVTSPIWGTFIACVATMGIAKTLLVFGIVFATAVIVLVGGFLLD